METRSEERVILQVAAGAERLHLVASMETRSEERVIRRLSFR